MAGEQRVEKTPIEAKQGIELFCMRYVLGISLALAIAGMVVAFVIYGKL